MAIPVINGVLDTTKGKPNIVHRGTILWTSTGSFFEETASEELSVSVLSGAHGYYNTPKAWSLAVKAYGASLEQLWKNQCLSTCNVSP